MPLGGCRNLVGEHVHDDQRMRFRIRELLGHFLGRIERVHVYKDTARLEDAEGGNREGKAIRHLQRDPVALPKTGDFAQVDREGVGHLVHLLKA